MNYAKALIEHYPGTEWYMADSHNYDTLEWFSESPKPTKEELGQLGSQAAPKEEIQTR